MRNAAQFVSTLGALVMAATPLAAIASAVQAQDMPSVRIQTADLDLGRSADAAVFGQRVTAAAHALCRPTGPVELARVTACDQAVRADADAQLRQTRATGARRTTWVVADR